ncbi:MAG: DUF6485 family protein [Candidatus Aenigmatarchaeota archaeon]
MSVSSCPSLQDNKEECSCAYSGCPRKGKCCEYIRYHKKRGEVPGCLFPEGAEGSYDRSIERFVKAVS